MVKNNSIVVRSFKTIIINGLKMSEVVSALNEFNAPKGYVLKRCSIFFVNGKLSIIFKCVKLCK